MDFEFDQCINRMHRNKSPLKILQKGSVSYQNSRECPNFLGTPVISGMGKAMNFKFCMHIHMIDRTKTP